MSNEEQLKEQFTPDEVDTARSLLSCTKGPITSSSFRRILLLLLRGHYASPSNYMEFQHLSCYRWTSGNDRTLAIEFTHNEDDQTPDNFPGIFVGFANTGFTKMAIGDVVGRSVDLSTTKLGKEARAEFAITHVTKTGADSYDLAEMTAAVLLAMGTPLAMNSGAQHFEVVGIATPTRKKPLPDGYYAVATTVRINYILSATRSLESHRIRRILPSLTPTT